jgi:hypothetical protein
MFGVPKPVRPHVREGYVFTLLLLMNFQLMILVVAGLMADESHNRDFSLNQDCCDFRRVDVDVRAMTFGLRTYVTYNIGFFIYVVCVAFVILTLSVVI